MKISAVALVVLLFVSFVCCIDLEVQVFYNGKPQPQSMYLRGDGLGLNWDQGILMQKSADTDFLWTAVLSYNASNVGDV